MLIRETDMLTKLATLLKNNIKDKSKVGLAGKYLQILSLIASGGDFFSTSFNFHREISGGPCVN